MRGGDRGTPRGTSKIRSRGYPAASNSRRAAGLLATRACARRQALLMPRPPDDVDLAETIALPAGPLRHEHHRDLRPRSLARPDHGPGLVHQAPDADQIELGRRAAASNAASERVQRHVLQRPWAAGRDARRGCHDNRFPPANANASGP